MWHACFKIALSPGAFSQVKLSLESRERVAGSALENNSKASHFSEEKISKTSFNKDQPR